VKKGWGHVISYGEMDDITHFIDGRAKSHGMGKLKYHRGSACIFLQVPDISARLLAKQPWFVSFHRQQNKKIWFWRKV
jgi:hypothetical protein